MFISGEAVTIPTESPNPTSDFPCNLCKKDYARCGYSEKDFDYSDDARCKGFLHV
jgi:hypothetical protein